jgi:hypothetical protein
VLAFIHPPFNTMRSPGSIGLHPVMKPPCFSPVLPLLLKDGIGFQVEANKTVIHINHLKSPLIFANIDIEASGFKFRERKGWKKEWNLYCAV